MKKLDLFGSQHSKPADSVLGIHLSVADTPSVSYRLLRSMPSLRTIRKDNYQDWLYSADEYPGACEAIASALESDDLGGNPNGTQVYCVRHKLYCGVLTTFGDLR